ncbi:ATP-binding protein [Cocleimonas sp. KMM 6892]|uniref:ATP-binding protein n=1 Tax=unclassified Cocleimonas TaxID=2639732 RepID=UPI002DBAE45C|nr:MULTISPECIES: ATP-binding protein [unclassified Cocleimonas]MEB8432680.1 ATP-binding protein [Cocleimonas sp. KMM 6892]MEC4715539.1 ATP-binding protein [Cocleimonas sp. KMM 6895]MEC4744843.1 ATP-binding protein [Cocleimonas sp. KMM 6896]
MIASILPLIVIAYLYDSHNSSLNNRLIDEKIEGEIQATVVKINSFIATQIKHLNDLDDLQGIDKLFSGTEIEKIPEQLLDFLYFQTSDTDIYSVEFYDLAGNYKWSLPKSMEKKNQLLFEDASINGVNISKPIPPSSGKPGWFYIYKTMVRKGRSIGVIALRIRLTSLTELTTSLYRTGLYEPVIITSNGDRLNVVGVKVDKSKLFTKPYSFLPGWSIGLKQNGPQISNPGIRYWLLFLVILSGLFVMWLFYNMSQRLTRIIAPLIKGARAIARGDFGVRVDGNIPGELGILARSFNNMSEQLSAMVTSRVDVERRAALGNLATGIAHEIRNPLATISTTVHGLICSEKDPERKNMLEAIDNEINRTDAIVEEFMNYARPREPKKEHVVIRDIFKHVQVLVSATALEAGVEISLLGQRSLEIHVDPGQIRQILMNIILNALKSMPDGGHLRLKAVQNNRVAEITVTDTGHGIKAEDLDKVKQPFFTTKAGGTGLGLAICVQLVKTNDGVLDIDSTVGEGTSVKIKFPVTENTERNIEESVNYD